MITNFAIICGLVCGAMGRQLGFVFMWSVLLHALTAIYLSVMLSPTFAGVISGLDDHNRLAGLMIVTAVVIFGGLWMLSAKVLDSALDYYLPEIWDQCGAGLCSFVAGFLVTNFLLFSIGVAPLTSSLLKSDAIGNPIVRASAPTVATACQFVANGSLQRNRDRSRHVIDWLIEPETAAKSKGAAEPKGAETTGDAPADSETENELTGDR